MLLASLSTIMMYKNVKKSLTRKFSTSKIFVRERKKWNQIHMILRLIISRKINLWKKWKKLKKRIKFQFWDESHYMQNFLKKNKNKRWLANEIVEKKKSRNSKQQTTNHVTIKTILKEKSIHQFLKINFAKEMNQISQKLKMKNQRNLKKITFLKFQI